MSEEELRATLDLSRRASITLANARRFERERSMSEQLQLSLLTEPARLEDVEIVSRYIPAADDAQVGGDWYDAFVQRDGSAVVAVGDVIGHDLTAAGMMAQLRSIMRGMGVTTGTGPARLLSDVDTAISMLGLDTSATVAAVRIERSAGQVRLRYSNAGHPPPVLLRNDGTSDVLDQHDLLLGIDPGYPRDEHVIGLHPHDTLLMFTDGLVERRGEHFDDGLDRLRTRLNDLRNLPLRTMVDQLLTHLIPDPHEDDVLALRPRAS